MAAPKRRSIIARCASDAALTRALERLADGVPAISLPFLDADECRALATAAGRLRYRRARPMVGSGARAVLQDFELTTEIPPAGRIVQLCRRIEAALEQALAGLPAPPLRPPLGLDDMIVQRYAPGSAGITAHRDHLRYTGLVALMTLSGHGRLFTCADRSGRDAVEVDAAPGRLVLMPAPGFAGRRDRPFHFLRDITRRRYSVGLRHDSAAGQPWH